MRNLLDGTDSRTLGRAFEGSQDACEELTDLVLQSRDGKAIAEEAERG